MDNIKIETVGHKIVLTIDTSKVIGQTEKGADKVAQAKWEIVPGTNLKLLVQLIAGKAKTEKVVSKKTKEVEEAPITRRAVKKPEPVVVEEPEQQEEMSDEERRAKRLRRAQRNVKKGIATENDLKVIRRALRAEKAAKPTDKKTLKEDDEVRNTRTRRPSRPSALRDEDADFSNADY